MIRLRIRESIGARIENRITDDVDVALIFTHFLLISKIRKRQ
jgi:hypothetical protein